MSPLGFKARVGSLIHTWWRPAWQPIASPHVCFSRGRMPDSIGRPPAYRSDVLTTRPPRPAYYLPQHFKKSENVIRQWSPFADDEDAKHHKSILMVS